MELPQSSLVSGKESSGELRRRRFVLQPAWAIFAVMWLVLVCATAWLQTPNPHPLQATAARSVWDWLRYPLETNAYARLPSIPAKLSMVHTTADGMKAWAVGNGGTIVATSDGGRSWKTQISGVLFDLWSVTFAADGLRGWAVGNFGTILATIDGGHSWEKRISGVSTALGSVAFSPDGQHGWVVGNGGTIVVTVDGGRTWAEQTSGVQTNLESVAFLSDSQRGWAVGNRGTIVATVDGGRTWVEQTSGVQIDLESVAFLSDGQRGWAVGNRGTIVATVDGGRTWVEQTSGVQIDLESVAFLSDGQRGWAVGNRGTIVATVDGGRTWVEQTSGVQIDLESVAFLSDGGRGWAVGAGGIILAAADGGRSWETRTSGVQTSLKSVVFPSDGERGWAVGAAGLIMATVNGGRSWKRQRSGVEVDLLSVAFESAGQRGWAVGRNGAIVVTTDGGRSWEKRKSGVEADLMSVAFASDGQRGWAVARNGAIVATADGGRSWEKQQSDVETHLLSVAFSSDGQHGWAVGGAGTIVFTADSGRSWDKQTSGVKADLWSVAFASDGKRGWAVGDGGAVVTTTDGGQRWEPIELDSVPTLYAVITDQRGTSLAVAGVSGLILQSDDEGRKWSRRDSGVGSSRLHLWMSGDTKRLWAVGYPPALLHSEDGGQTWRNERWPLSYARYPAPWFWIGLLLLPIFVAKALRRQTVAQDVGASAMGVSDAPTQTFNQDRLQFGPLARGLSRFLRNQATEPPLTVAISGDWGSGKSSLMQLVCRDLERYGCRPVWFNAWHHQSDEQLLAALLSAIRDQGLPRMRSLDGLAFRGRLLWTRSVKYYGLTLLCVTTIVASIAFVVGYDNVTSQRLWADLKILSKCMSSNDCGEKLPLQDWSGWLVAVATLIGNCIAAYRSLKAFGSDPAVLFATLSDKFRLKDAQAVTNFRARFGEQFREVAEALPYRMVIVIDDLDRCKPEAVLTVMESVNFLMSSGPCLIIFGMATHRVQAALAMSFERIAKEVVVLNLGGSDDTRSVLQPEDAERERRRHYAQDYLEKLINLEVQVPAREDIPAHILLQAPAEDGRNGWRAAVSGITRLLPLAGLLVAVPVGLMSGWMFDGFKHTASHSVEQGENVASREVPMLGQRSASSPVPAGATISGPTVPQYAPSLQRGEDTGVDWTVIVLPAAVTLLLMSGYFVWRLRESTRDVCDSAAFTHALEAWAPVVRGHRGTPRAVKRFGNRVRYLAMLQQAEQFDETGWDLLWRWLKGARSRAVNVQRDPESPASGIPPVLEEHRIVAFSALHEIWGSNWRACIDPLPSESKDLLYKTIADYVHATGASWPPSAEEMDAFERTLKGVRLPGDPSVIEGREFAEPMSDACHQRQ
ncbi:MAG: hypothetical protein JSR23_08065 [Proteobacteria bacterium]|nr:hypothetical protein [Pseudomonadota bacterium]